jgi:hypothetical protein
MAFESLVYYGFKATNNLSDVINSDLAIKRLTLDIGDLDIIRGAASIRGASREDLVAVSGLDRDIYKTIDRYIGDSSRYKEILDQSAGSDSTLRGNLRVNGAVGGSAVRYKFLNKSTDEIKFADISTSRVSAWSSTTNPTAESDPIFYGSQVRINSNSGGVGGTVTTDKLTWGQIAQPKLFDAEVPTHKITTTINGNTVKLYAMKSIPLKLDGYFRNFNGIVQISPSGSLRVSWRIINLADSTDEQRYANIGTTSGSTLTYRNVRGAPRRIEIYYPPDNFRSITLTSAGISSLPPAALTNLTLLNLSQNEFKDTPNFKVFSPTLQNLNLFRNNLYLAEAPSLRKFNESVASKLPATITSLNMASTFFGSITCVNSSGVVVTPNSAGSKSVIEHALPNLVTLNLSRTTGPYFTPDDYDNLNHLPSIPITCENYYVSNNDFRRIPTTGVTDRINLKNFDVDGNVSLENSSLSFFSFALETVNLSSTQLPIPNLSNRVALRSFNYVYGGYNTITSPFYTNNANEESYKFVSCNSLESLNVFASTATGFIPKFKGNANLSFVDMYAAQNLTGGRPNNGEHGYSNGSTHVMYKDTFSDAKNISFFRVLSYNLLSGKGFEDGTFKNLRNLYYLFWYSYFRTGSGATVNLPDIASCSNLQYFIMPVNNFSGSVPSFVSNDSIYYVDLAYNQLSGPVPQFTNKFNFAYLFLHNNQLSSFTGFNNTTNLIFVYLQNNVITGAIPFLSDNAPSLTRLYLFNNQFSTYEVGSFEQLTRIQVIDVSNNGLAQTDLNSIIDDLYKNYQLAPRRGVSINLRGQSRAPGYNPSSLGSEREQEIREKIDFLVASGWTINIGG